MTKSDKERRDDFNRTGSGRFGADQIYEDTMSYSETMKARGYELVDGEWR